MPAKVFVDTNIWLYSLVQKVEDDDRHRQAADFLLNLARPIINSQVIREICSNLIKKLSMPEEQMRILIHAGIKTVKSLPRTHPNTCWHPGLGNPMRSVTGTA